MKHALFSAIATAFLRAVLPVTPVSAQTRVFVAHWVHASQGKSGRQTTSIAARTTCTAMRAMKIHHAATYARRDTVP